MLPNPVTAAAVLVWAAFVFADYWPSFGFPPSHVWRAFLPGAALSEPPFLVSALGAHLRGGLVAALVLLSARGFGAVGARFLGSGRGVPFLRLTLGLALLGGAALGGGLLGLAFTPAAWVLLVAGLAAGGKPRSLGPLPPGLPRPALFLAGAALLPPLVVALAPEITYDALAYHLGAPVEYLKVHRIVRLEGMFFSDFPLGLQMSYLLALAAGGGDGAAKLVHWALGLAAVGAAARLGECACGRRGAAWAAVLAACTPFLAAQMMRANVDLGAQLGVATGVLVLLRRRGTGAAVAAGLCMGAAAGFKLTAGIGAVAGLVLLAGGRGGIRAAAAYGAAVAVPLAGWLARAWLTTGNPVYPFLPGFLDGLGWGAENARAYRLDMTGPTSFNVQYPLPTSRLAAPWLMVMHDAGSEAAWGPFILATLPLAVLLPGALGPASRRLGLFSLVYWAAWFVLARDPRFFLPALPALSAFIASLLASTGGVAATILRCALAAAALFTPLWSAHIAYVRFSPGAAVWGTVPRAVYVERLVPPPGFIAMARFVSANASPGSRVLVVGDVKGWEVRPRVLYQSMFDTPRITTAVRECASAVRMAVWMRQRNVGTVIYNPGGAGFLRSQFGHYDYTPRERGVLRDFWRRLAVLREARDGGNVVVGCYTVMPRAASRAPVPPPGEGDPR